MAFGVSIAPDTYSEEQDGLGCTVPDGSDPALYAVCAVVVDSYETVCTIVLEEEITSMVWTVIPDSDSLTINNTGFFFAALKARPSATKVRARLDDPDGTVLRCSVTWCSNPAP